MLPLAHVGHYFLWVLYAVPVLIVTGAIIKSTIAQRRSHGDDPPGRAR